MGCLSVFKMCISLPYEIPRSAAMYAQRKRERGASPLGNETSHKAGTRPHIFTRDMEYANFISGR